MTFPKNDLGRVPHHWQFFGTRKLSRASVSTCKTPSPGSSPRATAASRASDSSSA
jgi:hypothetical protein